MKSKLLRLAHDNAAFLASIFAAGLLLATLASREFGSPLQTLFLVCAWSPAALYDLSQRWSARCEHCSLQSVRLFLIGFLVVFIGRQLFVTDALTLPAEILSAASDRSGGGPLGEPDFDSLAIGCIGGICCLKVNRALRESLYTTKEIVATGLQTLLACTAMSAFWLITSWMLVRFGILTIGDFVLSRAVFNIVICNPKYMIVVPAVAALYVCAVLFSVRGHALAKEA